MGNKAQEWLNSKLKECYRRAIEGLTAKEEKTNRKIKLQKTPVLRRFFS